MATTEKLQFVIDAQDNTKSAFKSVESGLAGVQKKIDDLQPTFTKMAALGTAGFLAIGAIAKKTFSDFADAEAQTVVSTQRLDNALENMSAKGLNSIQQKAGEGVDIFGYLHEQMDKVGKSAVQLGFDDEAAADAFSKLFQSTGDVDRALKEVQGAMDLSRSKGVDLAQATKILQMAHSGATKELKLMNLNVDDSATGLQNVDKIMQQVAGQSQAFAGTMKGQMEITKVSVDNLSESIGGALKPAFGEINKILVPLVQKFVEFAEAHPKLMAAIIIIMGVLTALIAILGFLGLALTAVNLAMLPITIAVLLIVAGIALLIWGIMELVRNFDKLKEAAVAVWDSITNWIKTKIDAIKKAITDFITNIKEAWEKFWTGVKEFFVGIWDSITSIIKGYIDKIRNFLQPIVDMINSVIDGLERIGKGVGGKIKNLFSFGKGDSVNDAIISPNGNIITTHPDDYIMAMKDPGLLAQGGGGITINVTGNSFMGREGVAEQIGDELIKIIKSNMRL